MCLTFCPLVLCRNSVVAVDLAVSKEMDTFHPHKQTRLYGITTSLSQCPPGNSPVCQGLRAPWGSESALRLLPVEPLVALITWQVAQPLLAGVFLFRG